MNTYAQNSRDEDMMAPDLNFAIFFEEMKQELEHHARKMSLKYGFDFHSEQPTNNSKIRWIEEEVLMQKVGLQQQRRDSVEEVFSLFIQKTFNLYFFQTSQNLLNLTP